IDPIGNSTIISHILPNGSVIEMCGYCLLYDPRNPKVPERKRRITVRKFRKEWSEGLLLPVTDCEEILPATFKVYLSKEGTRFSDIQNSFPFKEGDDVSDLLGITHYEADEESTKGETSNAPKLKKKYPRGLKGWYRWLLRKIYSFFRNSNTDGNADNISLGIPVYD